MPALLPLPASARRCRHRSFPPRTGAVADPHLHDDDDGDCCYHLQEGTGSTTTPAARVPLFADLNCMPSCYDDDGAPMNVEAIGTSADVDAVVARCIGLPAGGGREADLLSELSSRAGAGVEHEEEEEDCKVDRRPQLSSRRRRWIRAAPGEGCPPPPFLEGDGRRRWIRAGDSPAEPVTRRYRRPSPSPVAAAIPEHEPPPQERG